jgi:hypothetical protein
MKASLTVETVELFTSSLLNGHVKLGPLLRFLPKGLVNYIDRSLMSLPPVLPNRLAVHATACYRKPIAIS